MSNELRRIGVSLIVEGGEAYVAAMTAATSAEAAATGAAQSYVSQIIAASTSEREAIDALKQLGLTSDQARAAIAAETTAMGEQSQALTVVTTETRALTEAAQGKNAALNEQEGAANRSTAAHMSSFAVMREGRLVMGALAADMALMTIAAGEQMPQAMREAAKGIDLVVQGAMMGQLVAPGIGAVLGGIAGGALAIATAATTAAPDITALNVELDRLGKHDDATQGMMNLGNVEETEAANALKWMKAHADAALALRAVEDSGKSAIPILSGLADALGHGVAAGGEVVQMYGWLYTAEIAYAQAAAEGKNPLEALAAAHTAVHNAIQGTTDAARDNTHVMIENAATLQHNADMLKMVDEIAVKTAADQDQINKAQRTLVEQLGQITDQWSSAEIQKGQERDRAWQTEQDAEASAARTKAEAVIAANQAMDDAIAKANRSMAEETARANQTMQDSIDRANQTLGDSLAREAQSYADKLADIARSLSDKEADLEHTRETREQAIDQQLANDREVLAQKLVDIARQENEQLAANDWSTHDQLNRAKTDNEREAILERSQYEKSQIRQRSDDQRTTAAEAFADQQQRAAQERALADQEFAYRMQLAQRDAAERRADALRQFAEQTALAQQRDAQEIAAAQKRDAEELALIQQRNKDAVADAQLRDQQAVASAEQRNRDMIADAKRRYDEETALIDQRTANEERRMMQTEQTIIQRNLDMLNDLKAREEGEIAAIKKRYDYEDQRADQSTAYQLADYTAIAQASIIAAAGSQVSTQATQQQLDWVQTIMRQIDQGWRSEYGMLPKRHQGGDVEAGQSYLVKPDEEIFIPQRGGYVVPYSQMGGGNTSNSFSYGGHTFNIYGATDPKAVAEEVRRTLSDETWR